MVLRRPGRSVQGRDGLVVRLASPMVIRGRLLRAPSFPMENFLCPAIAIPVMMSICRPCRPSQIPFQRHLCLTFALSHPGDIVFRGRTGKSEPTDTSCMISVQTVLVLIVWLLDMASVVRTRRQPHLS